MAWIRMISENEADEELAELYERVAPGNEPPDNVMSIHSLHPRSMRDHFELYRTLMYGSGPLSRRERELVALAVSVANDCHYWVTHHGAGLRKLTDDDDLVTGVAADPDGYPLGPRERALVDWSLKLTRSPGSMREADLGPLRAQGLDDRALLDLAMIVGYYAYVNRITNALGVELESG